MRRRISLLIVLVTVASLAFVAGRVGIGSATTDHRSLLINRAFTEAESGPLEGDRLKLYGSGTWSLSTGAISARGAFVHYRPGSGVVAEGYWVATKVKSFESFGPPDGVLEGGILVLRVKFIVNGQVAAVFDDFRITCVIGDVPPGAPEEGVTAGPFTDSLGVHGQHRFTLFFRV